MFLLHSGSVQLANKLNWTYSHSTSSAIIVVANACVAVEIVYDAVVNVDASSFQCDTKWGNQVGVVVEFVRVQLYDSR